ncbi:MULTISPECIES: CHRD domain-containing protein [Pontibacter]|uniref:CHRD domain-containing protein n=1 Tax=Pontibacter lucknowensis TaxID=1077936 RepID=A0A1N7B8H0_9BACT|nr:MULTISPECIES: CHRD domain-containing protein [Pontibacter]EJF10331.1 CHRD [Pontibacter sp. BAB1700]SIR47527.1 CHRD domain-containing protein [Pontibacter lucknowensis]
MEYQGVNIRRVMFYCLMLLSGFIYACDDEDDVDDMLESEIEFTNVELSGENEVPAVATSGSGSLTATYDRSTRILTYNFSWTLGDAGDNTVGIHFHGPALATENAPVVIPIENHTSSYTGSVTGATRELTQTEEEQLLDGRWYLNIHSSTYPDGELRGQLLRGEN